MAAALAAFSVLAPATSWASTASLDTSTLRYHAAPGEANALSVHLEGYPLGPYIYRLTDTGTTITPGQGCQATDSHTVECRGVILGVDLDLGDLNDTLVTTGAPSSSGATGGALKGGDGDDRMTVEPNAQERATGLIHASFDGGPGNDVLRGIEGADIFDGGPGDDSLDGGPGVDTLRGGEGRDELRGALGDDRVSGGAGNDRLFVDGRDKATGDEGDDSFLLPGLEPASIVCGAGRDSIRTELRVGSTKAGPWLSQTCEQLATSSSDLPSVVIRPPRPVAASAAGRLRFRLPCGPAFRPCRGLLTLARGQPPFRVVAKRRLRMAGPANIAVQLPRDVAKRARRQGVRLRARLAVPSEFGAVPLVWRFNLKLR